MIYLVATLRALPGKEKYLAEECAKMAKQVREKEEGCLKYVPYVSVEDPAEIVFVEQYVDSEALDSHRKTPHMQEFRAKIGEAVAGAPELKLFNE